MFRTNQPLWGLLLAIGWLVGVNSAVAQYDGEPIPQPLTEEDDVSLPSSTVQAYGSDGENDPFVETPEPCLTGCRPDCPHCGLSKGCQTRPMGGIYGGADYL